MKEVITTYERVSFYIEDNIVLAFFPDTEFSPGTKMCYSHIGQHSACTPEYIHGLTLATKEQYTPLLQELNNIGYNLVVIN